MRAASVDESALWVKKVVIQNGPEQRAKAVFRGRRFYIACQSWLYDALNRPWLRDFFGFTGFGEIHILKSMWYVNKTFNQAQIESLSPKGFTVRSSGGVVRIEKYGCGAELRKSSEGRFQMTVIPSIMAQGQFTHLWDAGYQKFLLTHDGTKIPVRVMQLGDLRRFNEELRTALGVSTYYNEALGSTCQYSVYDRVKGRVGDVPDETVGAHEPAEH